MASCGNWRAVASTPLSQLLLNCYVLTVFTPADPPGASQTRHLFQTRAAQPSETPLLLRGRNGACLRGGGARVNFDPAPGRAEAPSRAGGPDQRTEPSCGAAGAGRSGEPRDAPLPPRGPRCRCHHHQRRRFPAVLRPPQRPAREVSDPEGGRPSGRRPVRPPAATPVPTGRREGHGRRVRPCPHRRRLRLAAPP